MKKSVRALLQDKIVTTLLFTILIFTTAIPAFGQDGDLPPPTPSGNPGVDLRFEHLTSEQGLSNNCVLSVIRDSQGFMWFGTLDGLNRYDGYEPNPSNGNSLARALIGQIEAHGAKTWLESLD